MEKSPIIKIHFGKVRLRGFSRRRNHIAYEAHRRVLVIGSRPYDRIGKASTYCTVDKCLTKFRRGRVLRWIKYLTIGVAQFAESIKHMIEELDRRLRPNSAICAVFMSWLGQFIRFIIDQAKITCMLKR